MGNRKRTAAVRLDPQSIVRTALALLDEVGLEGLTLRRIAERLDVQAPALYWHFKNKRALLDDMAATMLKDLPTEGAGFPPEPSWTEWLTVRMRGLRRMLLGYRDGAKVFSGAYLTDEDWLGALEAPLRVLTSAGFSISQAARALSTLYAYTIGFVIEEQAVEPRPGERDERYSLENRARRIDAGRFPLAVAAGTELFRCFDEGYEEGLRLILSGIAHRLDR